MKLFGHPDSGHALKVKFFMQWAGIDHDYEAIDIFSPRESRSAEFRAASKFCEVPTLIDGENNLCQSNAMLLYLADKFDHFTSAEQRQQNLEWLLWEANKIGMCLPQLRADKLFADSKLSDGAREWLMARYEHDVNIIDAELSDGRKFLLGDTPNIADFSLSGYLLHAADAQVVVPQHVNDWLDRLRGLNAWEKPQQMLQD